VVLFFLEAEAIVEAVVVRVVDGRAGVLLHPCLAVLLLEEAAGAEEVGVVALKRLLHEIRGVLLDDPPGPVLRPSRASGMADAQGPVGPEEGEVGVDAVAEGAQAGAHLAQAIGHPLVGVEEVLADLGIEGGEPVGAVHALLVVGALGHEAHRDAVAGLGNDVDGVFLELRHLGCPR